MLLSTAAAPSPCADVEGRARVLRARGAVCAKLAAEHCDRFYETDPAGRHVRLCGVAGGTCTASTVVSNECSVDDVRERCRSHLSELRQLAGALRARGTDVAAEDATVAIAEAFDLAIQSDVSLPLETAVQVLNVAAERAEPFGWMDGVHTTEEIALQMPLDEAIGVEEVLLEAIEEAREALHNRPAGFRMRAALDWMNGTLSTTADGWFSGAAGDTRSLLTGFNALEHHLSVAPDDADQLASGSRRLPAEWQRRLESWGVSVISVQLPLAKLLDSDEKPNVDEAHRIKLHLEWASRNNLSVVLHLSHYVPSWAEERYADLVMQDEEAQHGVHYDIDHPFAATLLHRSLRSLTSHLGCPSNLVGIELANEPAFRITGSRHAKKAFEQWLRSGYQGDLERLKRRWGEKQLTSFAAASTSAWRTDARFHGSEPPLGSQAATKFADWCMFNEARVLAWSKIMVDAIREGERDAHVIGSAQGAGRPRACHRTFMRLNNALLLDPRIADHGIDRSALARLLDLHAFDSNFGFPSQSGAATSFETASDLYDTRRYAIDWLNTLGSLTFLRSLDASKPAFNACVHPHQRYALFAPSVHARPMHNLSLTVALALLLLTICRRELHIFSATKWRKRILDADAARAVRLKVLFAATLGEAGHMVWVWSRNRQGVSVDPACTKNFDSKCAINARWSAMAMQTQPRGFAAYMRAMLLVQAHITDFARLAAVPPKIWLLHSQATSRLTSLQELTTLALLEPLTFLGAPIGFIDAGDPDIEALLNSKLTTDDWLLVPCVTHAPLAALRAVQARATHHAHRTLLVGLEGSGFDIRAFALSHNVSGVRWSTTVRGTRLSALNALNVSAKRGGAASSPVERMLLLERILQLERTTSSTPLRLVRCIEVANAESAPMTAHGVFCRSVRSDRAAPLIGVSRQPVDGSSSVGNEEITLFIANLRARAAKVQLLLVQRPEGAMATAQLVHPSGVFDVWSHSILAPTVPLELAAGEARLLILRESAFLLEPSPPSSPAPSPGAPPPLPLASPKLAVLARSQQPLSPPSPSALPLSALPPSPSPCPPHATEPASPPHPSIPHASSTRAHHLFDFWERPALVSALVVIVAIMGSLACILLHRACGIQVDSSVMARRRGVRVLGYRSKYSKVLEQDPAKVKDGDSDVESVSSQGEAAADAADLSSTEKSEDDGDHLVAMKMHTDAGPRAPIRAVEQVEEHVVEDEDEDDAAIIAALQREPSRPLSAPPSGMDLQQSSNPAAGRAPMLGGDWDE